MAHQFSSMISKGIAVAVIVLGIVTTPAFASKNDFADCRQVFANSTPPVIQNQDELKTRALCFSGFAVMHSGKSHTPVYAAERLTKQPPAKAGGFEIRTESPDTHRLNDAS